MNQKHTGIGDIVGGEKVGTKIVYWGNVTYNEDPKRSYLGDEPPFIKSSFDRSKVINEIKGFFDSGIKVVVIYGKSGLGKSALASLFLHLYKYEYDQSGWVVYRLNICKSIVQAFDSHGTEIGGRKNDALYEKLAKSEIQWLRNNPQKRLIVVNGITDWKDIEQYIQFFQLEETYYLLTSPSPFPEYNSRLLELTYKNISIPLITDMEVKEMFDNFCQHDLANQFVEKLNGNLFLIHLLLKQAPAPNPKQIHDFYETIFKDAQTEEALLNNIFDQYQWQDAELWTLLQIAALPQIEFNLVYLARLIAKDSKEIAYLKGFENFKTENPELLTADDYDLGSTLKTLADNGWLNNLQIGKYNLHPLLRHTLKTKLSLPVAYFHDLSNMLVLAFFTEESNLILDDLKYEEHLRAFLDFVPEQPHELYIQNLSKFIVLEKRNGHYREELKLREKHLLLLEQSANNENTRYVQTLVDLAECYLRCGKYNEAEKYAFKSLQIGKSLPNFSLGVCYTIIGLVRRKNGEFEDAKDWLGAALQSAENNFGKGHPRVAVSQSNLANVYRDLGRYEEASKLLEAALQSDLNNFGKGHPRVAASQSDLANVYGDMGRYEEASKLLAAALQSDLNNFGKGHPRVAVRQSNLALVYGDMGKYEEASKLLAAALQSDINNFGKGHPEVAVSQSNLALVYRNLGRHKEAKNLYQQAIGIYEQHFDSQHPSFSTLYRNLFYTLWDLKEKEAARAALQRAYEIALAALGETHPQTKRCAADLERYF